MTKVSDHKTKEEECSDLIRIQINTIQTTPAGDRPLDSQRGKSWGVVRYDRVYMRKSKHVAALVV